MDLNKVILCGRFVRDVEVAYLPSGTAIGKFTLAVNRRTKKGDEYVDEPVFIDCALFGKIVDSLKQYMTKGKQVNVVGELKYDTWVNQEGQKQSKHSIVCEDIQLLGSSKQEGSQPPSQSNQAYNTQPSNNAQSYSTVGFDDFPF